jgi:Flp pilus assembly protein TadD
MDKEAQTYEVWTTVYPRDFSPHNALGANYDDLGQFDKALAQYKETLRLAPNNVNTYANLGITQICLNQLNDAKATFSQALARGLDSPILRTNMYMLAFQQGDRASMQQQAVSGSGKIGEDVLLTVQSDTEAYPRPHPQGWRPDAQSR